MNGDNTAEASAPGSRVFIGLGSNLEGPASQILQAIARLCRQPTLQLLQTSNLYRSPPLGPQDQPWFVNAVVEMRCTLTSPLDLLHQLQDIELAMGRRRDRHWGPRIIDLDLLLFGEIHCQLADLTLPHPGITARRFVLEPLSELAPELVLHESLTVGLALAALPPPALERL